MPLRGSAANRPGVNPVATAVAAVRRRKERRDIAAGISVAGTSESKGESGSLLIPTQKSHAVCAQAGWNRVNCSDVEGLEDRDTRAFHPVTPQWRAVIHWVPGRKRAQLDHPRHGPWPEAPRLSVRGTVAALA